MVKCNILFYKEQYRNNMSYIKVKKKKYSYMQVIFLNQSTLLYASIVVTLNFKVLYFYACVYIYNTAKALLTKQAMTRKINIQY